MTPLSPNFTLEEMVFSEVALRKGLPNTPNAQSLANLTRLCLTILEPARDILGMPLHINSGYRSIPVNASVGGSPISAHTFGRAADFVPIGRELRASFEMLRAREDLPFDQIIIECDAWIHISVAPDMVKPRREALLAAGAPGRWTYQLAA